MWISTLILLFSWNGVFGTSTICIERASSVCQVNNPGPSFPETEAESKRVCLILQRKFRCLQNYAENCGTETIDVAEGNEIERFSEVVTQVCRKHTQLHSSVFGTSTICIERASSVCQVDNPGPSFPETEAELERVCLILQRKFRCLQNYAENCGTETIDVAEGNEIERFSEVVTQVCRKDTQLHLNVAQNLPCLKDIFEHAEQQCKGFTRNALNHLYEQVVSEGSANADENHVYEVFECLYVAVKAHCIVTQTVEKCGSRAKDAVLEIMDKLQLVDEDCPASVQNEVLELLNVLALATEEEVHVKSLLGSKK